MTPDFIAASPRLIASVSGADDPALEAALAAGVDAVLLPVEREDGLAAIAARGAAVLLEAGIDALRAPDAGERLARGVIAGAAGVRLRGIEQMELGHALGLLAAIRERAPQATILAGPLGAARGSARAMAAAGVTGFVTSFGWWDLDSSWLLDEEAALRPLGPLFAEIRPDQMLGGDEPGVLRRRLTLAAAGSGGAILPAGALADPALVALLRGVSRIASDFGGESRRLSAAGAPVGAWLRADAPDARSADRALVLLVNRSAHTRPAPDPAIILPPAGLPLGPLRRVDQAGGDPFAPLAGAEVRLLVADRAAPVAEPRAADDTRARQAGAWDRLVVEEVQPAVAGGDFPVRRVVGERVEVVAVAFGDGHEQLAAEIQWRGIDEPDWHRVPLAQKPNDRWTGSFVLPRLGRHEYRVEAWLDLFGGFRRDFAKKKDAGVAEPVDYAEGRALVADAAQRRTALAEWVRRLEAAVDDPEAGAGLLLDPALAAEMAAADERPHAVRSPRQLIDAERLQARFSSWYELFPRSMGSKHRHGTFRDVIGRLPAVRDMGFDTLYFPPIHPIGRTNRKGPNNTLTPGPDDPGSPYAIGAEAGGHDAIHPELGSFEDFRALVDAARAHGLEIALDFAINCSPDHPWLRDHPGWFSWRPDGTIKYAENPPKKYQDIVNVDFYGPEAVPALWTALRDVILLWIENGVKTFRVDNPHTKPLPFWEWMIGEVRAAHPDVIFLAEAFTRPAMMYRLAKIGFSQSYTYFTWRDDKAGLTEYITELTSEAPKEFYRPHFFVNTPDINPYFLQTSGRPGFRIRAVLAATLSGLFGVYSGFELCEAAPLPGKEEYLDSEKFELRPRYWTAPGNIIADITLLNRLRRAHPALQTHLNTRFYRADNDRILYYAKPEAEGQGMILVMVNLDPHAAQSAAFEVPLWEFGLGDDEGVGVEDLARGYRFRWQGKTQTITLAPEEPYRIWRIAPDNSL